MKKKSERAKLIDKIHAELRKFRLKQEPQCVTCNGKHKDNVLQLGHLITKGSNSVRFDLRNLHITCRTCNSIHEYRPEIYTLWFIQNYGQEEYEALVYDSKQLKQWKMGELRLKLEEVKKFNGG